MSELIVFLLISILLVVQGWKFNTQKSYSAASLLRARSSPIAEYPTSMTHFTSNKRFQSSIMYDLKNRDRNSFQLSMSTDSPSTSEGFDLGAWFNPNTRGGVIVWSTLLIVVPIVIYNNLISSGLAEVQVGAYVGAAVVLLSNLVWAASYVFRVANKDMTYAKQLRDYENAVLQKRLEELGDDEINALMQEIDRDDDVPTTKASSAPVEVQDNITSQK